MTNYIMDAIVPIVTALTAGGGAFFGLKASLNGTKQRVERIDQTVDRIERVSTDTNTRLSILEVRHEFTDQELQELKEQCKVQHG